MMPKQIYEGIMRELFGAYVRFRSFEATKMNPRPISINNMYTHSLSHDAPDKVIGKDKMATTPIAAQINVRKYLRDFDICN